MTIELTKDSVDLGIIVSDADAALRFYRDTLGLAMVGQDPVAFGGTMYRLMCGSSMIKLLHLDKAPPAKAPPGGIPGAFGYRYWTISVSNLEEITAAVEAAGYKVAVPVREIRPGVSISMVEDPDGNWVEFLRIS
jgi:catechol 2,3-dioxygenase-like lactoylglutathione lyase family enzyme